MTRELRAPPDGQTIVEGVERGRSSSGSPWPFATATSSTVRPLASASFTTALARS